MQLPFNMARRLRLSGPVVTLYVDAQARLWGRLVVVLLAGLRFLWGDVGVGQHLEGMAGRHQPDRVVALLEYPALGCGRLLDGQLGQRVGLQPLVGDRLAAADRPAVAAGGKPGLSPLQRRPPCSQELVDGGAGLLGVAPIGVVDLVAQLGRRRFPAAACSSRWSRARSPASSARARAWSMSPPPVGRLRPPPVREAADTPGRAGPARPV